MRQEFDSTQEKEIMTSLHRCYSKSKHGENLFKVCGVIQQLYFLTHRAVLGGASGRTSQQQRDRQLYVYWSGGEKVIGVLNGALTQLRVPVADPGQLLDVPVQHIGQQIARSELNRIPAQSLADLRHRNTQ